MTRRLLVELALLLLPTIGSAALAGAVVAAILGTVVGKVPAVAVGAYLAGVATPLFMLFLVVEYTRFQNGQQ